MRCRGRRKSELSASEVLAASEVANALLPLLPEVSVLAETLATVAAELLH